jgi:hypothetical protein
MFSRNRRLLEAAKDLAAKIVIIDAVIPQDKHFQPSSTAIDGPFRDMTVVFSGSVSKERIVAEGSRKASAYTGSKSHAEQGYQCNRVGGGRRQGRGDTQGSR